MSLDGECEHEPGVDIIGGSRADIRALIARCGAVLAPSMVEFGLLADPGGIGYAGAGPLTSVPLQLARVPGVSRVGHNAWAQCLPAAEVSA